MLVDYHVHAIGHNEGDHSLANLRQFAIQAQKKEIKELGIADHNRYYRDFNFENIKLLDEEFAELQFKLGIEMDYTPGEEKEIAQFLDRFPLDFVIGSIHYLGDWMFDHPDYIERYKQWDIDKLYAEYFKYVVQAAEAGLFDIIGHLDLIKVFDYHPQAEVLEYAETALQAIAKAGLCIEINTNGLNKPVEEVYPSYELLTRAYQLEIPVTLSSDAHIPQRVGEKLSEMRELIKKIGYTEIATFNNREQELISI
ncbi:histidinol-phosphatase HisJ family protein [Fuchsiella alkaliacetigena]|uniref:histidinol-phosphatase HisJ family protein n=1 Tax=Fuchsiella alkaliacetigena TaxID=957042 RepID=UPI00200B39E0|nr:histidinol-phosphatase HisJ family protein [Fuchsiella alkaliacetigena]MCK8825561.1 histidinol-phosphatase HisJ family protein [Fuchsiella alkaliacetigena]